MPDKLPQEFLEEGLAAWTLLRRYGVQNAYLSALRSPSPLPSPPAETDPYSLRIARRVADVVDRLTPHTSSANGNEVCNEALTKGSKGMFGKVVEVSKPRYALHALAVDVRRILSAQSDTSSTSTREWDASILRRQALATTVMEGLHVLTLPGVQLRLDGAVARLRERLSEEMTAPFTANEAKSLRKIQLLLNEFEEAYMQLLGTFPCVRAMGSPHISVALMPVIHDLYIKLGEWVLAVEDDAESKSGPFVKSFEKDSMRIMMLREDVSAPWGLQLNELNRLCGLSASVRVESSVGTDLHKALSSPKEGIAIATINLKPYSFEGMDHVDALAKLEKITRHHRRIYLTLKRVSSPEQKSIEELAFFASEPTHEVPTQSATFIMQRHEKKQPWKLAMTADLILLNVPQGVLSKEATQFVRTHDGQLRVGAINGVEVGTPGQVKALSATVNTLVVELQVVQRKTESVQHHEDNDETMKQGEEQREAEEKEASAVYNEEESISTFAKETESIAPTKASSKPLNKTSNTKQKHLTETETKTSNILNTEKVKEPKGKSKKKIQSSTVIPELSDDAIDDDVDKPTVPGPAGPLSFPNEVTLEFLTAEEMILQRNSTEQKWGVSLRTSGDDAQRNISILALPDLKDSRRQRHPYYKMFNAHVGKWNIRSVNGTSASQLPDVLDILKYALRIKIKFHRL